jgi:hypothetical protein
LECCGDAVEVVVCRTGRETWLQAVKRNGGLDCRLTALKRRSLAFFPQKNPNSGGWRLAAGDGEKKTMGDETEVLQSVSDLPVQDPPGEEFSAADLRWAKHHCDDVALIPYDRMEAFISGERHNPEYPTRFHIERGGKSENYIMYAFPCCHLPCCAAPALLAMFLGEGLCSPRLINSWLITNS